MPDLLFVCLSAGLASAQSLSSRVLIVYNSANAESVSVAQYYRSRRGVPNANLCAISPPSTTYLTLAQYEAYVKVPVRACLNAVGRQTILYIVFTYQTPYRIAVPPAFSLDSAVADIWDQTAMEFARAPEAPERDHAYYAAAQSQGNVYASFMPLATYRAQTGARTIYSVWRLDGATSALAKGLVDKAMWAETNGLAGIGCFDRNRGDVTRSPDLGYTSGEWDIRKAAEFTREAGYAVLEDANVQEFGTGPAPARCDGAALYSGWYSLNNYPDAFTWRPGAIGFHLDSSSALDPRGGTNWTAKSVQRGITITSGAVSEPYLDGLVHPDGFFRNILQGANVGDAMLRNTRWLKWMNINTGDPLYRPFPGGRSPFNRPRPVNGLSLVPNSVLGDKPVSGIVFLDVAAPAGGAIVALTSTYPTIAAVPANVVVPAGLSSAAFQISTDRPVKDTAVLLEASYGGITRRNGLLVAPLLSALRFAKSSVVAGGTLEAVIWLSAPAPAGGATVTLTASDPAVSVPARVTIPGGRDSARFNVPTKGVATKKTVTITASHGGANKPSWLTVLPASLSALAVNPTTVLGSQTASGTVTLNGVAPTGGFAVTLQSMAAAVSVPPSVLVPAGAASASFPITTRTVSAPITVQIRGTLNGITRAASLRVLPPTI